MNATALVMTGHSAVEISEVSSREHWESLFARVPRPHLPQSWSYGEAKRLAEGWRVVRLVLATAQGPVALCQVLGKRVLGVPVARINRGPLFLSESAEIRALVWRALRQRWRFLRRGLLLIAPSAPEGETPARELHAGGFLRRKPQAWGSSLIRLQPPLELIHQRLSPEWRNKLRRAQKLGVSFRVSQDRETLEWLLARHEEHMRIRDFAGPSPAFVRALFAASPGDCVIVQALVNGEPHAGTLLVRFGQHAEYFIAWFDEVARRAAAGNALLWQAVVTLRELGCHALDLGGYSVSDRYGQFKRGMRGEEYRLAGEWLAF
jgi:hypothetical protein